MKIGSESPRCFRLMTAAVAALSMFLVACNEAVSVGAEGRALPAPAYDSAFWTAWGDGRAELAGYDLTFRRYGQPRHGTAVTIFVTETFSNGLRVKADPGRHPESDEFPVLKLNLVQDFPTGIYDYNLMTSVFVALSPVNGRSAGTPTKVSFSSQEWCGQLYHQLLFDAGAIRSSRHSYFDGEADRAEQVDYPERGIAEDGLLPWARGLAAPVVQPDSKLELPLLRSVQHARLDHEPLSWTTVTLTRDSRVRQSTVPAGTFDVTVAEARIDGGPTWTFQVEKDPPHRLIRWSNTDGLDARLLGSTRTKYWEMNAEGFESELSKIGLQPRGKRMP